MTEQNISRIGIILQAYNQGKYVDDTINSLKAQTFQDFEVNLVDDGSNDGYTPEKLASLDYDKITRRNLYKQNKGAAFRQRQQYKVMKNEFVMILCGDDVLAPTFLEKTIQYMDKHPNCGAVSTHIVAWYSGEPTPHPTPPNYIAEVSEKDLTLGKIIAHEEFLGSSLMRKSALDSLALSPKFKRYQDWDRWISLLEAGWSLGNVPEPLFYYRQLPSSLAHSATVEDEMEVRRTFFNVHEGALRSDLKDYYLAIEKRYLIATKNNTERCNYLLSENEALKQQLASTKQALDSFKRPSRCAKEFVRQLLHLH